MFPLKHQSETKIRKTADQRAHINEISAPVLAAKPSFSTE
jgi:hypothetical protein